MQTWQRVVTLEAPAIFNDLPYFFEIRNCYLTTGTSSTLYCTPHGKSPFAVASLSSESPCASVRVRLPSGTALTCSDGDMVAVGVASCGTIVDGGGPIKKLRIAAHSRDDAASCEPFTKTTQPESVANVTFVNEMRDEDADLQERRAALRRASAQTTERNRIAFAKEVAEKVAADNLAEERAAAREAAKKAEMDKMAEAKRKLKEKEQSANDSVTAPPGRRTLQGGLTYDLIKVGLGSAAAYGKKISVRYEGRLARNGKLFDRGTIKFCLGKGEVIRGWDEGVKGMRVGEQRKLHVPAHLGYGRSGAPPKIPANADLVFVVTRMQS